MTAFQVRRYGERAIFAEIDTPRAAEQARMVALAESARRLRGVIDAVAADGNCTIFTDDAERADQLAVDLPHLWHATSTPPPGPLVEIGAQYGNEYGEDFADVCRELSLSAQDFVTLHSSCEYTVMFLGYRPGFAYLGDLPEALRMPRRRVPRTRVPAGSVAIAASMTSVYPSAAPGGWHLIGRTAMQLFDPHRAQPTVLRPGMRVRFTPL